MPQLTIDLPPRPSYEAADFLRSASNETAIGFVESWPDWPGGALCLHGPQGSGKTHLLHIWQERSAAHLLGGGAMFDDFAVASFVRGPHRHAALDDSESAPEEPLFHLFNACRERGGSLLLTSRRAPAGWAVALPDLRSRLRAALAAEIRQPDDALLCAVLAKHFADRQLRVEPRLLDYLARHMERSFSAAATVAAELDVAALSAGQAVTVPLARHVLGFDA